MADLEAEIPEQIEQIFDDLLAKRCLLVGKKKQEIDVRPRRQRSPAVATHRDDGHAFAGRKVRRGKDVTEGEIMDPLDHDVLDRRQSPRAIEPAPVLTKSVFDARARLADLFAQKSQHLASGIV